MSRTPHLEHLKRMMQRQGAAAPAIDMIVAEVRSNDVHQFRPPPQLPIDYVIGTIIIEWTFGVPYQDVPKFHQFLKDREPFIAEGAKRVQGVRYLGTYWVVVVGSDHYRTLWAYDSPDAIEALNDHLLESQNLYDAVKQLRSYWANDPSRQELRYQPAALLADLRGDADQNAFVKMALEMASNSKSAPSTAASPKLSPRTGARVEQHLRVTAGRSQERPVMRMLQTSSVTNIGKTAHFEVSYFTRLGQKGADLARAILQNCEQDYTILQEFFGGITPDRLPFVVQVTSGNKGASHSSCMGTDIVIGGNSADNVDFIRALLVAEVDEVFMAKFGLGWDCIASNGEGLSRVLANDLYKGAEPADFISSDVWLNLNPRPNYIDNTDQSDTNYESIGCSVLFLNWLRFQLDFSWTDIIKSGGASLADTYKKLTGRNTAWGDFEAVINAHFPIGGKYPPTTDNPFPV